MVSALCEAFRTVLGPLPSRLLGPRVRPGGIGVYPVGVLSLSFFERLGADLLIGRRESKTSAWVQKEGRLRLNGKLRDIRSRWRLGLPSGAAPPSTLPEVILVAPNADQLEEFLDELMGFFSALDAAPAPTLADIPKFLLASSGLYLEDFLKKARNRVELSGLARKDLFQAALRRRVFRAVAYQAGIRRGGGDEADYQTGAGPGYLILSRSGTREDRRRILGILAGDRGYDVRIEGCYLESEYDKALVNLTFSAFTQLYAVREGRLLSVRFGDLLQDSRWLPAGFEPQELRERPAQIRARIAALGRALVNVAKAKGVYAPEASFEEKFGRLEKDVLAKFARHIPSSFQIFMEMLRETESPWGGGTLLPTERWVIRPLISAAEEAGDAKSAAALLSFERDLLAAYAAAIEVREGLSDCLPLARRLIELRARRPGQALLVGINGLPGAGKSTLTRRLTEALGLLEGGLRVASLSIDDFYHSRAEMSRRGILRWGPGAHDLGLAPLLTRLKRGRPGEEIRLPVFDKKLRDRSPQPRSVFGPFDVILFEGFGVGLDSRGYRAFSSQLDFLVSLKADPEQCRLWRREAGWADRQAAFAGDEAAFEKEFSGLWELISTLAAWIQPEVEKKADLLITVRPDHRLRAPRSLAPGENNSYSGEAPHGLPAPTLRPASAG